MLSFQLCFLDVQSITEWDTALKAENWSKAPARRDVDTTSTFVNHRLPAIQK